MLQRRTAHRRTSSPPPVRLPAPSPPASSTSCLDFKPGSEPRCQMWSAHASTRAPSVSIVKTGAHAMMDDLVAFIQDHSPTRCASSQTSRLPRARVPMTTPINNPELEMTKTFSCTHKLKQLKKFMFLTVMEIFDPCLEILLTHFQLTYLGQPSKRDPKRGTLGHFNSHISWFTGRHVIWQ